MISHGLPIFVALEPVDMRLGADGWILEHRQPAQLALVEGRGAREVEVA